MDVPKILYTTSTDIGIHFFLPVNMANFFTIDWADKIFDIDEEDRKGWQISDGGYAFVTADDCDFWNRASVLDSPAPEEMKEREDSSTYPYGHWYPFPMNQLMFGENVGTFDVSLALSAGIYAE